MIDQGTQSAPQDVSDFVGEVQMQMLQGSLEEGLSRQRDRQRAWLKRKRVGAGEQCEFRVRKRYRKSAYQWLNALHHQIKQFHDYPTRIHDKGG